MIGNQDLKAEKNKCLLTHLVSSVKISSVVNIMGL